MLQNPSEWRKYTPFYVTPRVTNGSGFEPGFLQQTESASTTGRGWVRPHYGEEIIAWLRALPKPIGVLARNDIHGPEIVELCMKAGIRVPDQIAILGVDNDDLECELSHPSLSSVNIP